MKSYLLIEKKNCYYIVSLRYKMILNISQLLFNIIKIIETNKKEENIHKKLQKECSAKISKKEFHSQLNKYHLLKENLYFEPIPSTNLKCDVTKNQIKTKSTNNEVQLLLESTFLCNLSCVYCSHGKYYTFPTRKNYNMDLATAIKAIDYVINWRKEHTNYFSVGFYGGESLLNFDFLQKVVSYCESIKVKHNISFEYGITTNGVLLDRYIDYLTKYKFKIGISLDGDNFNNSFRVFHNLQESYPLVFKNVSMIREKYPEFYRDNVYFQSVRHKMNYNVDLIKFFNETFQKPTIVSEVRKDNFNLLFKEEFFRTISNSTSFSQSPLFKIRNFYDHVCTTPFFWIEKETSEARRPSDACLPFQIKTFITTDGEILPCEQIGVEYNFGKIDESGVHLDFDKLATKYSEYFKKIEKSCRTCYKRNKCDLCMFNAGVNNPDFKKCPEYLGIKEINRLFTQIIK